MKRTIIITLAMLIVFGGAVIFGADRVSNDWQQPQKDNMDIVVSSPVNMVENSLKEYKYTQDKNHFAYDAYKDYEIEFTEGMISPKEAVAYGCTAMENVFPHLNLEELTFGTVLINWPIMMDGISTPAYIFDALEEPSDIDVPDGVFRSLNRYSMAVDAYTGKVVYLALDDRSAERKITETAKHIMTEQQVVEHIVELCKVLGYDNPQKYCLHHLTESSTKGSFYEISVLTEDNQILVFNFDAIYSWCHYNNHEFLREEYMPQLESKGVDIPKG